MTLMFQFHETSKEEKSFTVGFQRSKTRRGSTTSRGFSLQYGGNERACGEKFPDTGHKFTNGLLAQANLISTKAQKIVGPSPPVESILFKT